MIHGSNPCFNLESFIFRLIITMDKDNALNDAIPSDNSGDVESIILHRPFTFDDAVNVIVETSQETQAYVKNMHDGFQTMTTQIISAITDLSNKNINRKFFFAKKYIFFVLRQDDRLMGLFI